MHCSSSLSTNSNYQKYQSRSLGLQTGEAGQRLEARARGQTSGYCGHSAQLPTYICMYLVPPALLAVVLRVSVKCYLSRPRYTCSMQIYICTLYLQTIPMQVYHRIARYKYGIRYTAITAACAQVYAAARTLTHLRNSYVTAAPFLLFTGRNAGITYVFTLSIFLLVTYEKASLASSLDA